MAAIPKSVLSARLLDTVSGHAIMLTTRPGSGCHFANRFQHDDLEVQLRVDWSAIDANGDPTLDADFFKPHETKPLKRRRLRRIHHTAKAFDDVSGEWVYDFRLYDLRLRLLLSLTRQGTAIGNGSVCDAPGVPQSGEQTTGCA